MPIHSSRSSFLLLFYQAAARDRDRLWAEPRALPWLPGVGCSCGITQQRQHPPAWPEQRQRRRRRWGVWGASSVPTVSPVPAGTALLLRPPLGLWELHSPTHSPLSPVGNLQPPSPESASLPPSPVLLPNGTGSLLRQSPRSHPGHPQHKEVTSCAEEELTSVPKAASPAAGASLPCSPGDLLLRTTD